MRTFISLHDRPIPVYMQDTNPKKALEALGEVLNRKLATGRAALRRCIQSLISIEIIGSEATLHALREHDTRTISLY
jgi:hypothetical protein